MVRFVVLSMVFFAVVVSCMGQMFQYSRGWTNGKRSVPHLQEYPAAITTDVFEVPTEADRSCVIQLERLIRNPYLIRPSFVAGNNARSNLFSIGSGGIGRHHQSNEIFEDLAAPQPVEFSSKHN